MKTPDPTTYEDRMLGELAYLFATVNKQVLADKSPTAFARKWTVPPKKFHRLPTNVLYKWLYSSDKNWRAVTLIAIGLALLLMLVISLGRWSPFLAFIVSLIMVVPPLWTCFDLSFNEPLHRGLQMLTRIGMLFAPFLLVVLISQFAVWNVQFAPLDTPVRLFDEAMGTSALWVFAMSIAYWAVFSFATYLLIRLISIGAYYVFAMIQWILRYHTAESTDSIKELLNKRLNLCPDGDATTILELDSHHIDALHEWATLRRQVIQDKLIPTTLLLALLGILANTSLAEGVVGWFSIAFRDNADAWAIILRLGILGLVIALPARTIAILLSESYSTGVIAQACVLIRQSRVLSLGTISPSVDEGGPPAPALPRWLAWIKRILLS